MITMMMTTNFSEIKKQGIMVSKFGGGEEIRVFGENIDHC